MPRIFDNINKTLLPALEETLQAAERVVPHVAAGSLLAALLSESEP